LETEELFNRLIDGKLGLLRSVALRMLRNKADADDAVQSALLKAWAKRRSFNGESALLSWLFRITVNESTDMLRKRRRETERNCDFEVLKPRGVHESEIAQLESAIKELPQILKEAVELVYIEQLETAKAAEALGCEANTLYQRLHKARRILKEKLKDDE